MNAHPCLSDAEWALVVELVEQEHNDLPHELHHTRLASYREGLRRRAELVTNLLERLHATRS